MATVIKFPAKTTIPKELEERLQETVNTYLKSLDEIIETVYETIEDEKECCEMLDLMIGVVMEGVMEAINNMDES